ncbi:MAG: ABC1 kinase family protein, partial [Holosporales bacterium]
MMDDSNGVTHRLKRYANVTTSLGGSALKFAGAKVFGLDVAHEAEAEALTKALGQLKGPVMKVAQMLATIPDAVQPEYASAFLQLQSQAPSMGAAFVKRRMQKELGIQWRDCFAEFSLEAAAAASLGQVHRASLPDGTSVACKLQYPDMASTLEADLNQLRLFLKLYEKTLGALDTEGLFVEISSRLREELDYRLEAKHMALFQKVLADIDGVHVPTSFPDLSTDRLLTMAWLEGKPLRAMQDLPQEQRNQIARTLFRTWYVPFYHYGLIHG